MTDFYSFLRKESFVAIKNETVEKGDVHRVDSRSPLYNLDKCRMISFLREKSSSRLDELLNSVAILRTISVNSYVEGK